MTFEDMMKMKRLGETAVSPDGKWLAYSVTTVNLDQNTKTAELWLQAIAPAPERGEPFKLAVAQPGDSGVQFSPDGQADCSFLSGGREGAAGLAGGLFGATGATASNAKKLTSISTEADNAKWSPDGKSIVFHFGGLSGLPGDLGQRTLARATSAMRIGMRRWRRAR
jgi:dipeptidyl aminopeptidase/acylaminoacyl peptidase